MPINIETIASISQLIGTATIVGGTVFGLIQLYELKKQSRNTVAGELMRTFMGAELANGIMELTRFSGRVFAFRLCSFLGQLSPFEVDR